MRKTTTILILGILLFSVFDIFAQGNIDTVNTYYSVPNTDLKIKPPKYFIVLPTPNTLLHAPTSSTIQINEISGSAYKLLIKNITPEYIEKQKAHFISKQELTTDDGKDATLITVSFMTTSKDSLHTPIKYKRLMLFTGNYNKTVWVNANYPVIAEDVIHDELVKSLLSIKFDE